MSRAIKVSSAGGQLELVEVPKPTPAKNQVLIRVVACGVCHGDASQQLGHMPGTKFPIYIGHEVAGIVEAVGEEVTRYRVGDRVGTGWTGGYCRSCNPCRDGDFVNCPNSVTHGIQLRGGFADYMVIREEAVCSIPNGISLIDAAPILCAGATTFNALKNCGAPAGALVAIVGIGGLGHLGIQYAKKLGYRVAAISRGTDKEELSRTLGADHYINTDTTNPAQGLQALGGASVILSTATSTDAITAVIAGLGRNGKLILVGIPEKPLPVFVPLIIQNKSICGAVSGVSSDIEQALNFTVLHNIRPQVELFTLDKYHEAWQRMLSTKAKFRVVIQISQE